MCPVMANHLLWYDTVLLSSATGYAKTLLEFLFQHSSHKSNKKVSFDAANYSSLLLMISSSLISCFVRHSLKSGPETRDLGPWDLRPGTLRPWIIRPGTLRPEILGPGTLWPWDVRPWTLGLAILGHGILTTRILVMGIWDPVTSNWPPPQIVLTLFVKQILKGYGMCVENVWAGIQK